MLPTIAPIAVPPSLDEPGADVGTAEVGPEVTEDWIVTEDRVVIEDWVDEAVGRDPVEEVTDGDVSDVMVDSVGGKVEEGVGDTGGKSVVLGGVGPP